MLRISFPTALLIVLLVPLGSRSQPVGQVEKAAANADQVQRTVGRMYLMDGQTRIGTAFVAGETFNIFTPAHVAVADTMMFAPYKGSQIYRVALKCILPEYDLAIFARTGGQSTTSLVLGDFRRVRPGDQVRYLGWDSDHLLWMEDTLVIAKGEVVHEGELIDFIDIEGKVKPGYSGGPVLNKQGQVVAMIVQGWDVNNLQGQPVGRMLRAFSIDLLRVVESRVQETLHSPAGTEGRRRLSAVLRGGE